MHLAEDLINQALAKTAISVIFSVVLYLQERAKTTVH